MPILGQEAGTVRCILQPASQGHKNVIQPLLDHGAKVNAAGNPLGVAKARGRDAVVQLLLKHSVRGKPLEWIDKSQGDIDARSDDPDDMEHADVESDAI